MEQGNGQFGFLTCRAALGFPLLGGRVQPGSEPALKGPPLAVRWPLQALAEGGGLQNPLED